MLTGQLTCMEAQCILNKNKDDFFKGPYIKCVGDGARGFLRGS